jgi:hypothetical protein
LKLSPAEPSDWQQATEAKDQAVSLSSPATKGASAGLAPLVMTLVELIRQLMEAQIIRRMDRGGLTSAEIERAGQSLQALHQQILQICDILEIDPTDLNIDLGDMGRLLPKDGDYYPGQPSQESSILELLDRLINTGVVVDGEVDVGLAQLDLIHVHLKLVLTSSGQRRE